MGLLDERVVIVTGGGQGLGRSHCLELAKHGARVVVDDVGHADADGETAADKVVAEIKELGGEAVAESVSVTDWTAMGDLVNRTIERWGRLDAVVNNAGIVRDRMITSLSEEDWDAVIAVHLKGTFTLTKHACDYWRAQGKAGKPVSGRIVNTTSGAGLFGNIGQGPYVAAKAGIAAFTMTTGMEMERYGVTANAISPIALTAMTAGSVMSNYQRADGWDPMDASNASPVVVWLCSEESGWLNGSVLRIEGNTVMKVNPWSVDDRSRYRSRSGEALDATELNIGLRKGLGLYPRGIAG